MMSAVKSVRLAFFPMALAAMLTACAAAAPSKQPVNPAPFAYKPAAAPQAASADARFAVFVRDFRATALAHGVTPGIYDRSMAGIARNPAVEQANLQQPEFAKPIWDYLDSAVSDRRVAEGAQLLAAESGMLVRLERRFGVGRDYLVAIWGIESNYGAAMGRFDMFEALATLAYDGPRAEYGKRELIAALKMEQREDLDPKEMTSSWAGAFGQTQFVPSSFLKNAVDADGDGKIDLWHSPADALGSTALLLADAGWTSGAPCGREVALPAGFDYGDADIDIVKTAAEWKRIGVREANGDALAASDRPASILVPAGARGPAFIVFDNFKTLLKYNNAESYALAVCYLADRIKGGAPIVAPWPRRQAALTRDQRIDFQTDLKKLGYDPGDIDGILGRRVRASLRAYQKAHGIPADGFATEDLLSRMEREIAAKGR